MVKKRKKMVGTVQRIIKPVHPNLPEKAQIEITDGEELYKEIRIDNEVADDKGEKAGLKQGAEVEVIVEAETDATVKKPA